MSRVWTMITGLSMIMAYGATSSAVSEPVSAARVANRVTAKGETQRVLERAWRRLCSPPLNDARFVLSDVNFELTRRFTEYSGDISGRMLGAMQAAEPILGANTSMTEALIEGIAVCQKADGHFGADQDLATEVQQGRDMPILWGNGRLLLALAERYRQKPDPRLLALAQRLGDYVISTRPYYGKKENFERVGGMYSSGFTTCYPSLIDGLAALAEVSGDPKYAEEGRFIARLSLLDRAFEKHHSHGRLTAFRGMLDLDRQAGASEFVPEIIEDCRRIRENFMLPTGGITETFDLTDPRDEGCTEADWIRINLLLWHATGEPMYLDMAEHVLRNHLMATQFSNGGFGHHNFRTLSDNDRSYRGGGITNTASESYWCCSMHGTQVLADVARWGVLANESAILITWLAEGTWTFQMGNDLLEVTIERGSPRTWKITVSNVPPNESTLRLRVPGWTDGITLGGARQSGTEGWVEVRLRPEMEQTFEVGMQYCIRRAGVYGEKVVDGEPVRLFAGPELLCLADADMPDGYLADDAVPQIRIAATEIPGEEVLVTVAGKTADQRLLTRLVPVSRRPPGVCRYLFHVEQVDASEFLPLAMPHQRARHPIELMFACDGDWELYLNGRPMLARSGWGGESPTIEAYGRPGENVVAVKMSSKQPRPGLIGMVRTAGGTYITRPDAWSAAAWPQDLPTEWLTDPDGHARDKVKLEDLGGWGVEPWKHGSAEYAGTNARWIWPASAANETNATWLVWYRFSIDEVNR